ncbi:MAG TPA: hypothetical protein VMT85_25295 [Thermoanaerobaculia bacterium]|nr:hypothetical protein [Thermoanaerobaculia bacterium]
MPQSPTPVSRPRARRRSRRRIRLVALVAGLALLPLAAFAVRPSARSEEPAVAAQPRPIPAPPHAHAPRSPSNETPATSAPSSAGGAGWMAVTGGGAAEMEAADLLREWAASAAPRVPPVEEKLPNGTVKLHHRGHFLSTLYATLDAQGRLVYSHDPPIEPEAAGAAVADPDPDGAAADAVDSSVSKGGAR